MKALYASPMRVYLSLLVLALFGVWMGTRLPVSLFPNSAKPHVYVNLGYGSMDQEDFKSSYGGTIESRLRGINTANLKVEKLEADYGTKSASYDVEFQWGSDPQDALREATNLMTAGVASYPKEVRDSLNIYIRSQNSGFFAASFYSETRPLDAVYKDLEPILTPRLSQIEDAKEAELWNPNHKKIVIELDPARMASLQLTPAMIQSAVQEKTVGFGGGSIEIGDANYPIVVRKPNIRVEDLASLRVATPAGQSLLLGDIAKIDYRVDEGNTHVMKTSGSPSLILWAAPKPGGNVKKMSEDILELVDRMKPLFPADVKYKVLVDPSEFIRGAIENVFHEVLIGSLLAVGILFLFIGSFRNVVTAAIEIPLSMVLAFILMKFSGMNLNLISLGGLALASGMNVDASVVVLENIFRHLEKEETPKDFAGKLRIVMGAVKEVRLAVIASTIASLVVFAPLAFTSALSYAVLGDLAKTVIFSHGFSAFVALLLVPTVRLHLIKHAKDPKADIGHSPIEGGLKKLEAGYARALGAFVQSRKLQVFTAGAIFAALAGLFLFALPKLPKEVLGTPDTDWVMLGLNTQGNTIVRQMEGETEEVETRLLQKFGDEIRYTFTQVNQPNSSWIMARLKDKRKMKDFWKRLEAEFKDGATLRFWINPWNPAELPLPNPPDLRIAVEGGDVEDRRATAKSILDALKEKKVLPSLWTEPGSDKSKTIVLRPNLNLESSISPYDLADILRVATEGKNIHYMNVNREYADIMLRYPRGLMKTAEELGSFPVGIDGKVVPLRALSDVRIEEEASGIHSENGRELYAIIGRKENSAEKTSDRGYLKVADSVLADWRASHALPSGINVVTEDAQVEVNDAIHQLTVAVALSIAMILLTLLFQMGSLANSLIVLVAIPLGFIGVLTSLLVFQSTLSLNSVLGVILLNGIAVANSIILVDFGDRRFREGMAPKEAVVGAAVQRLRPILITSLTTILGMLPVALGFGQGGRILQPLGIAVSGGLWFSMALTLFVVPALQYRWLSRGAGKAAGKGVSKGRVLRTLGRAKDAPGEVPGLTVPVAPPVSATMPRAPEVSS
ncbi:MAG: efflux RND transporter permease subunit [Bdellovibrionales bacterium]|nr:efflux RND transporter permease subunit [Bdellovibrionales bacterium]